MSYENPVVQVYVQIEQNQAQPQSYYGGGAVSAQPIWMQSPL